MQIKNKILEVLKSDTRLWVEEELNYTKLIDLVENIDEKIITLLLQEESLRNKFFTKILNSHVFKTRDFKFFIEENKVNNSYTQYKNSIGLTDGKRFLKDTNDVVLNFPFKDCILEGGQSSEDGTDSYFEYDESVTKTQENQGYVAGQYNLKKAKRKEVFFNEVLAKDEIDRLKDPKAFVNWKGYTKDGLTSVENIKRDEHGTIKENLIIKGNNLLALHSLKEEFKGKVKLIYIDPPYNTGNDSFGYNDTFNHSTWLTFMKNRLEVAKELLRDDGVIFIQCDYNEDSYLRVLMDEIFGIDKFIANIAIKSSTPSGTKTAHKEKKIIKQKDTIISYKKKDCLLTPQHIYKGYWDKHYSYYFNPNEDVKLFSLKDILKEKGFTDTEMFNVKNKKFKKFYLQNAQNIVRRTSHKNKTIMAKCLETPDNIMEFDSNYYINKDVIQPLSKSINDVFVDGSTIKQDLSMLACDFWSDIDFQNTQNEGGVSFNQW